MRESKTFKLEKPIAVWFLGGCFIVSPFANMAIPLFLGNIPNWYLPRLWFGLFTQQDILQQILLATVPLAGFSLLIQRKTSWAFAVGILFAGCVQNMHAYFSMNPLLISATGPLILNCCVLIIFYYFRFPYLDRRDHILHGTSDRLPCAVPVSLGQSHGLSSVNLSSTGCLLMFPKGHALPAVDASIQIQLDDFSVECRVLRQQKNACAVRFLTPSRLSKKKLRQIRAKFSNVA
jgi:hypothetical protein